MCNLTGSSISILRINNTQHTHNTHTYNTHMHTERASRPRGVAADHHHLEQSGFCTGSTAGTRGVRG